MKKILLTKGKFAFVDDEDFGFLNRFVWKFTSEGYAVTTFTVSPGERKEISMHRFIMNPYTSLTIDHVNNEKADNRKENLRVATRQQQCFNRAARGKTSRYKGISFRKKEKKWEVRICKDGKVKNLGMYFSEEEAATIYAAEAKKLFGDFAWKKQMSVG